MWLKHSKNAMFKYQTNIYTHSFKIRQGSDKNETNVPICCWSVSRRHNWIDFINHGSTRTPLQSSRSTAGWTINIHSRGRLRLRVHWWHLKALFHYLKGTFELFLLLNTIVLPRWEAFGTILHAFTTRTLENCTEIFVKFNILLFFSSRCQTIRSN